MTSESKNWLGFTNISRNEFPICGAEILDIRKTGYAVVLRVGENPMSAETWSADSIVIGQWGMVGGLYAMPW